MTVSELERFLETLTLSEKHRAFKGFEVDLRGDLNPTRLLNELFGRNMSGSTLKHFLSGMFECFIRC